jgi:hypothetical protein
MTDGRTTPQRARRSFTTGCDEVTKVSSASNHAFDRGATNDRNRCYLVIAARSGQGLLTDTYPTLRLVEGN